MESQVYQQFNELEGKHWWFCARRQYLQRLINRFITTKSNKQIFCEVGSGTGGNLPLLTKFATVDAVEMNDTARAIIEEKDIAGVRKIYSGYLPNNMTHQEEYDAVFSLDVIEHVPDDKGALLKLNTYIKKDGWLITTVPAYQWLWSMHDEANHHQRRYTKKHYCNLIESAGYKIEYTSYFNTLLFPLAALSRLAEGMTTNKTAPEHAVLTMPSAIVNTLLQKIFELECWWAGKLTMPFGLSIVVVAKKK